MSSMSAIAKMKLAKGVDLHEFPRPVPMDNEVLIKVKISGICGSDLKLYNIEAMTARKIALPIILGHEFCGVVEALGPKVTSLQVGDRVAGEPHIPCMTCFTCDTGNAHICPHQKNVGRTVNGSFAEYLTVPEISVRKVPEALTDHEAALLEPMGVAVHAVRKNDIAGDNVLVLGCGPIGLMSISAAKAFGAARVFATGRNPEKLQKGLLMGADQIFNASDKGVTEKIRSQAGESGIGTVIDMSGSEEAIQQGLQVLRPGGTLVLAGIPGKHIDLNALAYNIYNEIRITGIFGRKLWESWILSEMLLKQGKIKTEVLMGSSFSVGDYEQAFAEAFSGKSGRTFISFCN
ncbi:MAG: alcohol dehydrogenase catalytic domain-containing protein [Desulfobacterales bacterium]|nr:alcohol dehydrogenase catalytic domain-containing protein [Desulfobacterales bacterium]